MYRVGMADLVKDLLKKTGIEEREIRSVGVGSPGTVDAHNGIVLYSNNFGWENVPLAKELEKSRLMQQSREILREQPSMIHHL